MVLEVCGEVDCRHPTATELTLDRVTVSEGSLESGEQVDQGARGRGRVHHRGGGPVRPDGGAPRPCGNASPPLACFVLPRSGFSTLASYHARPRPLRRRVGDRRLPGGRRDRHCKRAPHLRHRGATARRGKGGARARLLRHRELWIHLSVEAHYGLREKGENRVSPYPQTRIAMWLAAAT